MIPTNYEDWRHCIEVQCGISLTSAFAKTRLAVYTQPQHPETKTFVRLYGEEHLQNIITWLHRV